MSNRLLKFINVSPFLRTIKSPAIAMPGVPYHTDTDHEDLHLDERIMQLLQITSDLLKRDKQTHARSGVHVIMQ
ncbi:hypothetical protein C2G38_2236485 [Gigaspora rosea]|uniref:Uncharacterized protein n=1 Tax=Gigaspora rosea TaxID=44941 RepID=A0A397TP10_9GLOM|nr:hypothetical protein C2G38_2236485 [Gigaspora rosea]